MVSDHFRSSLRKLVVPEALIAETMALFRQYPTVECPVLWHGIEASESVDVVTTLTIPETVRRPYSYDIPSVETERVARAVIKAGIVPLAQIHTHPPDCGTKHSFKDNEAALSLGEGFLSIVVPNYGQGAFDLSLAGVHERIDDAWRYLDNHQKSMRIKVVPSRIDLRREAR